ncbi:hypothetical protein V6R98_20865 [Agrobacterium sp. CCNWLW71]
MLDFGAVFDRAPELLWATRGTFGLAFAGMALALVIGILGVIARTSNRRICLIRDLFPWLGYNGRIEQDHSMIHRFSSCPVATFLQGVNVAVGKLSIAANSD